MKINLIPQSTAELFQSEYILIWEWSSFPGSFKKKKSFKILQIKLKIIIKNNNRDFWHFLKQS